MKTPTFVVGKVESNRIMKKIKALLCVGTVAASLMGYWICRSTDSVHKLVSTNVEVLSQTETVEHECKVAFGTCFSPTGYYYHGMVYKDS